MPGPCRCIPGTSHYSRLEKPTIPIATQERLPRIYYVASITTHTHDRRKSIGEKEQRIEKKIRKGKKREERKTKRKRQEKRRKRQEKQEKTRQEEEARQGKKKRKKKKERKKNVILADPRNWLKTALGS